MLFFYDSTGKRVGFANGDTLYYYLYNVQGDVIAIMRAATGQVVAKYSYDAWGKCTVTNASGYTVGEKNPFRYRGYYYDTETGLYYLNSRYYSPEFGRFISADSAIAQVGNVQGANMFAYCANNPVNMSDSMGNWPSWSRIFTGIALAAIAIAAVAVTAATCGAAAPALALAGGGVIGGISSSAATVAAGALLVAGTSAAAAVTSAAAEKSTNQTAERNNSVYVLKDDDGAVQYVGRTRKVDKRRAAHSANPARAGLTMEVVASGLTLPEARALEQAGMAYHHSINTANKMNNQINSVAPKYWGAFKEVAVGVLNCGWNQMTNEILYWTGN